MGQKSLCTLGYGVYISLSVALRCAVVSLYSVVKQRLNCNTSKVFNYLIQFLLTMAVGHAVAQWLRNCATNRKVAGSIPDGVTGFFH
jgi:hypothetical protein